MRLQNWLQQLRTAWRGARSRRRAPRLRARDFTAWLTPLSFEPLEPRLPLASDLGDAPDIGVGTGTGDYQTLLANSGPHHILDATQTTLFLGVRVDSEADAAPNTRANGDDITSLPDDEDGLVEPAQDLVLTVGTAPTVRVRATNAAGAEAALYGWIDYNRDGVFDNATERTSATIPTGTNNATFTLTFPTIPLNNTPGATYARFRLSTDPAAANPTGAAANGEVEDYPATIQLRSNVIADSAKTVKIASGINGAPPLANGNGFGRPVTSLGDLDGDGVNDLVIGAAYDNGGGFRRGAVYVSLLNRNGTVKSNVKIGDATNGGPTLADNDEFGFSAASLGDVNGDGVTDLAVGAAYDGTGGIWRGAVHVLLLNVDGTVQSSVKIADNTNGGPTLVDRDTFGFSVAALGDLDGDGVPDLAVGAAGDDTGGSLRGAVYVLLLNSSGTVKSHLKIANGLNGGPTIASGAEFGSAVTSLGDLDGDGVSDLAVGAPRGDSGRGAVHILMLNSNGSVKSSVRIGHAFNGGPSLATSDYFGAAVASLGDLNGDGVADLAVGTGRIPVLQGPGALYVLLLNANGTAKINSKIASNIHGGPAVTGFDGFARAVTAIGDLDGDGRGDLAVGADGDDTGGTDRGAVYMLFLQPLGGTDYGDAPDAAAGTGSGNYQTLSADNGPAHVTDNSSLTLYLGAGADGEADGLPNTRANGDDTNATPDDEEGVVEPLQDLVLTAGTAPTVRVRATTIAGSPATLYGWIDYNRNGVFENTTERASSAIPTGSISSTFILTFPTLPLNNATGATYARFRLSTDAAAANPTGAASDGEVEDYPATMLRPGNGQADSFRYTKIAHDMNGGPSLVNQDYFGISVATLGDMDGDGVGDLAVGADGDDTLGSNRGAVYIQFMNSNGSVKSSLKIASGTNGGPTLADADRFGRSVTSLGDLDGDGVTDVAVGATGDDTGGASRGAVYVLLLNPGGTVKSSTKVAEGLNGGPTLTSAAYFGRSVAALGDLDGDGVTDMVVGAEGDDTGGTNRGAVFILLLNRNGTVKSQLKIAAGSNGGPTLADNDRFGWSVASLGDVDGDGVTDIAGGAVVDDTGGTSRGAVHVLLLNPTGTVKSKVKIAHGLNGGPNLTDGDNFGSSMASLGDLDGDGVPDLAVGADDDDTGGTARGAVHMLFLNANGTVKSSVKIAHGTSGGPTLVNSDEFGAAISSPGDLDGDGVIDLAVGATGDDTGGTRRGAVHMLYLTDSVNNPPAVVLQNTTTALPENTDTTARIKVADVVIVDDLLGSNSLTLSGADAGMFEIDSAALYLKAGSTLDYETHPVLDVIVEADDPTVGATPDDTAPLPINVNDVVFLTLELDVRSISENGGTALGTLTRSDTDLTQAYVVSLSSNDATQATVPATVTIPANQASATVVISAVDDTSLDRTQKVLVSASGPSSVLAIATLFVNDFETLTVTIDPTSMSENGGAAVGTVTRSYTDPLTALVVNLSSSDPSAATVPATVTIPANQASASFAITAVEDNLLESTQPVSITASVPNITLDSSFASDGTQLTGLDSGFSVYDLEVVADGGALLLGPNDAVNDWVMERYLASGVPDPSFGFGGEARTDFGFLSGKAPRAIANQPDGKIVMTGSSSNGTFVRRYFPSGSLDTAFGSVGEVLLPELTYARAIAVTDDGKILIGGGTAGPLIPLVQLTSSGQHDASFGNNGQATSTSDWDLAITDIALPADGKILVAGAAAGTARRAMTLARINANGTVDTSFGQGGQVQWEEDIDEQSFSEIHLRHDQQILVSGAGQHLNGCTVGSCAVVATYFFAVLVRPDGTLESTYGANGKTVISGLYGDGLSVMEDDGSLMGLAYFMAPELLRLTPSGTLDLTFGTDGTYAVPAAVGDFPRGLGRDAAGRIYLICPLSNDIILARFNAPTQLLSSSAIINVLDHESLTVTVDSSAISEAGGVATGTVSRSDTDNAAALVVNLSSSDATEAAVPATVTIPAQQASATFAITALDDALLDGTQLVTVSATATGYVGDAADLDVTDSETFALTIDVASISENGGLATATVARSNTDTSLEVVVSLMSNDTSEATVPATVTIPAHQASTTFAITANDDLLLDGTQTATITATAAGYGESTTNIDVTDFETLTVSFPPGSISESGGSATGTVTRSNTDNSQALVVTLSNNDTSEVTTPATVTILADQASATFVLAAVDDDVLDGLQTATISATATNYVGGAANIDVADFETLTVTIDAPAISENGGVATATVIRNNTDRSLPLVVVLSSSDTGAASVPTSVTIPADQGSATFAITAADDTLLDGTQTATIAVDATGYVGDTTSLDVADFETLTVTISLGSMSESGGTATGTVTRNNTDRSQPVIVTLASNDLGEATVPTSVTILANQASANFAITAVDDTLLDGTQTATVTATAAGYVEGAAHLDVTDLETLMVAIAPSSSSENGGTATGTVSRSNSDISQELNVTLASNDVGEATVPATVTIPANQPSVTFTISATDDALLDGTQTATITATAAGYASGTGNVDVTDSESVTLTIDLAAINEQGGAATGTVTRSNTDRSSALVVSLTSNDPSAATVPATVTIAANQASADFAITAVDDSLLDGTQAVAITAAAAGYVGGMANLNVTDLESLTVTVAPGSLSENGGAATGVVGRSNTDNALPLVVTLASDDFSEATVPPTVTIPANESSATFAIMAVDDALLDGTRTVTLSAAATGYVNGTRSVDVTDFETLSVSINAESISENGGATTGTVTRSNTDISVALTVTLASNDTSEARVPATVTILSNQASAAFVITADDDLLLDGRQTVTITVSAAGYVSDAQTVGVTDHETLIVTIAPGTINESGGAATGTVTRGNTDWSGELVVTLASNDTTEATVPPTVTIPANNSSATFSINAVDDMLLDGTQTVSISATATEYFGSSRTLEVTDFEAIFVAINAVDVSENGGAAVGTVTRSNTDVGSALVVALSSNDTTEATVPLTVVIPAHESSASFSVNSVDDTLLDGTQVVTITGAAAGYVDGAAELDVTDSETLTLTINAASISENGGAAIGTVTRGNTDTDQALVVELASSDTTEALVPASVTVPAHASSATFEITARDDRLLDGTQVSAISSSAVGYVGSVADLNITDAEDIRIEIVPGAVNEDGGTAMGMVTRDNTDISQALVVTLASSDTSEATVPAAVTIPAHQISTTFIVTAVNDSLLDGAQAVSISATAAGYVSSSGMLTVHDVETLLVSIDVAAISESGGATTGTVTRSNLDRTQPLIVTLTSSDATAAAVAPTVTILPNQASATFSITVVDDRLLDGTQGLTISAASLGYVGDARTIDVTDWETLVVTIDATSISENGGAATGTVTRSNLDDAQELIVTLASSDLTEATVPLTVTIPANQSSATFSITAVDDSLLDVTKKATVGATAGGFVRGTADVSVTDVESLTVSIDSALISENGGVAIGTLTRGNTDLSQELVVALASSDPTEAGVPATVTILANQASATFAITAVDDTLLDGTQTATIGAAAAGYVGGTRTIDVTDMETLTVTIDVAAFSENGGSAIGTVTRSNTDNSLPLVVILTSNDTTEAGVPASVTIAANQSSATFAITARDDTLLDGTQTATISGQASGYQSGSTSIDVTDFNHLPTISTIADQTTDEDVATPVMPFTVGDVETAAAQMSVTAVSSNTALVPNASLELLGAGTSWTVQATPAANAFGTTTITVAVDDGAQVATSSFVLTVRPVNDEPTSVSLAATSVSENTGGAIIGEVTVADPDLGDAHSYLVNDSRFEIVDGRLKLRSGVQLDFEMVLSIRLDVTARDSGNLEFTAPFTINVVNVNEPPTDIALGGSTLDENVPGAVVGPVAVVDPDADDSHSWATSDSRFEIANGQLKLRTGQSLSFVTTPRVSLEITARDAGGLELTRSFSIDVLSGNAPPTVSLRNSTTTLAEDADTTTRLQVAEIVIDDDALGTNMLSLTGAAAALFEIDAGGLYLRAGSSLNYEAAPSLDVTILVDDAAVGTSPDAAVPLSILVTDANELPTSISVSNATVLERISGLAVGTLTVADQDSGQTHTFAVADTRFEVVGTTLQLRAGQFLDRSQGTAVSINVSATDNGVPPQTLTQAVVLQVEANPRPWRNPLNSLNVDNNRPASIDPIDALLIINVLNAPQSLLDSTGRLPPSRPSDSSLPYLDTNGDGFCAPLDVLLVINFLNGVPAGEGELPSALIVPPEPAAIVPHDELPSTSHTAAIPPLPLRHVADSGAWRTTPRVARRFAVPLSPGLEDALNAIAADVAAIQSPARFHRSLPTAG